MHAGVTLVHPASTFIDESVEIGPETIIGPNVCHGGRV
jgi:bifunctional N-acetylglucosamine-1-phosphate-uridyltransferase/glucosamine-1-phosphate-acetyltransferase GlmU-like protein